MRKMLWILFLTFAMVLLVATSVSADTQSDLWDNRVAIWHFNGNETGENETFAFDSSGGGHNISTTANITIKDNTLLGKGWQDLHSVSQEGNVVNKITELDNVEHFTISVWVNHTTNDAWEDLFHLQDDFSNRILLANSEQLGSPLWFLLGNGDNTYGYTADNKYNLGIQVHFVAVYNGSSTKGNSGRMQIYINGVNESLTWGGTIPATTSTFTNDASLTSSVDYFGGIHDDLMIFNKSLTQTEIDWLYNSGTGRELTEPEAPAEISNVTNSNITVGDCTVSTPFTIDVFWDCQASATKNCTGIYNITPSNTMCTLYNGSTSGSYNLNDTNNITLSLSYTCTLAAFTTFNLSTTNDNGNGEYIESSLTCTAGGLSTEEHDWLEDAYLCLTTGEESDGTMCITKKILGGGGMLAIALFIMITTGALFMLPFKVEKFHNNVYANLIIRRSIWVLAFWLMSLNAAIISTMALFIGINLTRELFVYMTLFGWAGYGAMVFLVFKTLFDLLQTNKMEKTRKRMEYE